MRSGHAGGSAPDAPRSDSHRITAIDSLRALAVLSVVVYHLDAVWLPGGFAGVDIFFVISGYVVTRSFAAHGNEGLGAFLGGFYARRIKRILPALLVCLLATVTMDVLFVPQAWLSSQNFDTARHALLGLSNVFLSRNQESYFSPRIEFNPYAHTWSLGVEEQFYIVLPMLFFVTIRTDFSRRAVARRVIPMAALLSIALSAWMTIAGSPSGYYSLVSRFWELGAGALLARHHALSGARLLPAAIPSAVLSATLLVVGLIVSGWFLFPFPTALLVVAGSVLLIDLVAGGGARRIPALGLRPIVYVGTISYSIYLWHWPVFSLFRWTVGLDGLPKRTAALAVIAILSVLSYHVVERMFQRRLRRSFGRPAVIAAGLAAVAVASLVANGLHERQSTLSLSETRNVQIWYPHNYDARPSATGCRSVQRGDRFDTGSVLSIDRRDCEPDNVRRTLFVAGDSHVDAYMTMLGQLVAEHPYRVTAYTLPGCPFFTMRSDFHKVLPACEVFIRASLIDIARKARRGDVLFLPSLRMRRTADQYGPLVDDVATRPAGTAPVDPVAEARGALDALDRLGVVIVFEAPKPIFGAPAFRCVDWFNRGNPVCAPGFTRDAATLQRERDPVLSAMRQVESDMRNVRIWDPFPTLCPSETCSAFDGRTPLFFDGDHLSAAANRKLYPNFVAFLDTVSAATAHR